MELAAFGIEAEAYAFNLGWAATNLLALAAALLVAWERPQRRADERVRRSPRRGSRRRALRRGPTVDLSATGACVALPAPGPLPRERSWSSPASPAPPPGAPRLARAGRQGAPRGALVGRPSV